MSCNDRQAANTLRQRQARVRRGLGEDFRLTFPPCPGAKAALVGRAGYPAVVVWTRENRFVARVVPRSAHRSWSIRDIGAVLKDLLTELGIQVETVAYEATWRDLDSSTRQLLNVCETAAVCWNELHPWVIAREVKLYVRAPWSDDTEISGPISGWRTENTGSRDGYCDPVEGLDHLLIFAGETAGRIAMNVERKERERDDELQWNFNDDQAVQTGTIR